MPFCVRPSWYLGISNRQNTNLAATAVIEGGVGLPAEKVSTAGVQFALKVRGRRDGAMVHSTNRTPLDHHCLSSDLRRDSCSRQIVNADPLSGFSRHEIHWTINRLHNRYSDMDLGSNHHPGVLSDLPTDRIQLGSFTAQRKLQKSKGRSRRDWRIGFDDGCDDHGASSFVPLEIASISWSKRSIGRYILTRALVSVKSQASMHENTIELTDP